MEASKHPNNNALSFKSTLDDLQIKDFSLMLDTESEEEEGQQLLVILIDTYSKKRSLKIYQKDIKCEFHKITGKKGGLQRYCKLCQAQIAKKFREY